MKSLISLVIVMLMSLSSLNANNLIKDDLQKNDSSTVTDKDKLVVVWTRADKEVATKMVFMYTYNAKKYGWWNDITLLIWGPSSKLLSEDAELQEQIREMKDIGIELLACKACADQYEVSDKLTEMGVTVRYTGKDLTNFIKERYVVTF